MQSQTNIDRFSFWQDLNGRFFQIHVTFDCLRHTWATGRWQQDSLTHFTGVTILQHSLVLLFCPSHHQNPSCEVVSQRLSCQPFHVTSLSEPMHTRFETCQILKFYSPDKKQLSIITVYLPMLLLTFLLSLWTYTR